MLQLEISLLKNIFLTSHKMFSKLLLKFFNNNTLCPKIFKGIPKAIQIFENKCYFQTGTTLIPVYLFMYLYQKPLNYRNSLS